MVNFVKFVRRLKLFHVRSHEMEARIPNMGNIGLKTGPKIVNDDQLFDVGAI